MRTRLLPAGLAALAVLALASGCTGNGGSGTTAAPAQGSEAQSEQGSPAQADRQNEATASIAGQDRRLARTAQLAMVAQDVHEVTARARAIAVAAGGYSGSERTDATSATLSLSVPSDQLDDVVGRLSGLGQVTSSQQTADDVTEQVVDVESRLETARRSVERVRALLDRATSLSDITSIESQLASRESDLESLQARQKTLATSVAMATLSLAVTVAAPAPVVEPDPGFLAGLGAGWNGFLGFGRGTLHALGAALPFLVLFGVPITALVWLGRRRHWFRRTTPVPSPPVTP